jgi:glycolate oxidase FAD binding subunit
MPTVSVSSEDEIVEAVREARASKVPFEIVGHGTKRGFGKPASTRGRPLDVSGLSGIVVYEPEELILTVRPATPIAEIRAALDARGQCLGFDPPEWAGLFGANAASTIGGAVSVDASGSRRVRHGGARDHLLGIRAVNGLGEAYKAGGRVVKNVTGFDVPKLFCGAFGTLGVLTELTFRVFPKPSHAATLIVRDIAAREGFALLREIWSGPLDATGLAYVTGSAAPDALGNAGRGAALVRVEGAPKPLAEKCATLTGSLAGRAIATLDAGDAVFAELGNGAPFQDTELDVWRAFVPPSEAASTAEAVEAPVWYGDLAGGLLWFGLEAGSAAATEKLRAGVARAGGHATLFRADEATRRRLAVFPAEIAERAALTRAVKSAFDPLALFNPGRMYEGI